MLTTFVLLIVNMIGMFVCFPRVKQAFETYYSPLSLSKKATFPSKPIVFAFILCSATFASCLGVIVHLLIFTHI